MREVEETMNNDNLYLGNGAYLECNDIKEKENIKALIFDFDGTIVDTMEFYWKYSWAPLIDEYPKFKMTRKRFYSFAGLPVPDSKFSYNLYFLIFNILKF